MTRTQAILLGALGVQSLLVAAAWWPRAEATAQARAIIDLPADAITRVVVERSGEGAEPLDLVRGPDGWTIASSQGYPADDSKVHGLIDSMLDIQVRRPVATKAVNHDTLHVGDQDWGKKLRLETEDRSVELILGAASGQASHVRLADSTLVYAARGLSEWSIKDRPSSYWDAELIHLDLDSASAISIETRGGGSVQLARGDDGWTFEGPVPTGEMIDPDKLDRLAAAACTLRLREPVGLQALPEHGLDPPAARITVTISEDESSTEYSYLLGNTVDGLTYLQRPDDPWVVTVSEYTAKDLTEASTQSLLLSPDDGPPQAGTAGLPQGLPPGLDLSGLGL